jgi:hypothetical protein
MHTMSTQVWQKTGYDISVVEDAIARVGWRPTVWCAASVGGEQLDILISQWENGAPVGTASIWMDTHVTVYDANTVMGRERMGEPLEIA